MKINPDATGKINMKNKNKNKNNIKKYGTLLNDYKWKHFV